MPINLVTKDRLKKHFLRLLVEKEAYAKKLGYDFKLFEYGPDWILFEQQLKRKHPYLTTYNIVNFYKLHLLYELAKEYDAVELVKIASEILGGKGGGGRKDFAQAGGTNKDKIEEAFKTLIKKIN